MRDVLHRVMGRLISGWYHEDEVLERERRSARVRRIAIHARRQAEQVAGRPLDSYSRVEISR